MKTAKVCGISTGVTMITDLTPTTALLAVSIQGHPKKQHKLGNVPVLCADLPTLQRPGISDTDR